MRRTAAVCDEHDPSSAGPDIAAHPTTRRDTDALRQGGAQLWRLLDLLVEQVTPTLLHDIIRQVVTVADADEVALFTGDGTPLLIAAHGPPGWPPSRPTSSTGGSSARRGWARSWSSAARTRHAGARSGPGARRVARGLTGRHGLRDRHRRARRRLRVHRVAVDGDGTAPGETGAAGPVVRSRQGDRPRDRDPTARPAWKRVRLPDAGPARTGGALSPQMAQTIVLARQAQLALANAVLYHGATHQRDGARTLTRLISALSTSLDTAAVLDTAATPRRRAPTGFRRPRRRRGPVRGLHGRALLRRWRCRHARTAPGAARRGPSCRAPLL